MAKENAKSSANAEISGDNMQESFESYDSQEDQSGGYAVMRIDSAANPAPQKRISQSFQKLKRKLSVLSPKTPDGQKIPTPGRRKSRGFQKSRNNSVQGAGSSPSQPTRPAVPELPPGARPPQNPAPGIASLISP